MNLRDNFRRRFCLLALLGVLCLLFLEGCSGVQVNAKGQNETSVGIRGWRTF